MKILIIEDNEIKCQQIQEFLEECFPDVVISKARSYNGGLQKILSESFEVVILDMTLPTFDISKNEDGGRPQHYAGRDILRQMKRREISFPTIVITQYDIFGEGNEKISRNDLNEAIISEKFNNYLGMVYYNVTKEGWKQEFLEIIKKATL